MSSIDKHCSFQLTGTDGVTEIGFIQKKYRGFLAESMTSADAYLLQCNDENLCRNPFDNEFCSPNGSRCENESIVTGCSFSCGNDLFVENDFDRLF